jgi:hypothetical protein
MGLLQLLLQDMVRTLAAVAGMGLCFLAVSAVQALLLNNPALRNPRQRWYESAKARVLTLCEVTMSQLAQLDHHAGPQQLREVLLQSLA